MELKIHENVPCTRHWPPEDVLPQFWGAGFAEMLSSLQVDAVLMGGSLYAALGDSDVMAGVTGQMRKGEEGIADLKTMAEAFAEGIRKALPTMSEDYRRTFEEVLKDFDEHGFSMPVVGKII